MQNPYKKYSQEGPKPSQKKAKTPKLKKKRVKSTRAHTKDSAMTWVLLSGLGLMLSCFAFLFTDETIDFVSHFEIGLSTSEAQSGEKNSGDQAKIANSDEQLPVGKVSRPEVGGKPLTMENTNLYSALKEKRRELEKKERRLAQLEEELQRQKVEIEKQLLEMKEVRRSISSKLDKKVKADQENLTKLVGVYSSMKPKNAAIIISQLDQDLAIKVLGKMKKQNAAAILNFVAPKTAQRLSEKFTGLTK